LKKSLSSTVQQLTPLVERDRNHCCGGIGLQRVCVRIIAVAELPTRFGEFCIVAFAGTKDEKEHVALVRGDVMGARDVPVRLHSECLTGDGLGSLRCDCRDQLEQALMHLGKLNKGILLYLRQEGRGIGLVNKIRAYSLQDGGLDTVDANIALGFRDDERDYAVAAHMLKSLHVESIQLMTNNPNKVSQLRQFGITVSERIPHVMKPNEYNRFYLETKFNKSGHVKTPTGKPHLAEQDDTVVLEGME
jgi:GTP cyclohydrolase II